MGRIAEASGSREYPSMEILETARLLAAPLVSEDLPDLVALHLDSEVSRYLGGVRTAATTAEYVIRNRRHWADHGLGLWTWRTREGTFIGRAGLRYVELEGVRELEVAYALTRSAWGKGLASEISKALVEDWRTHCIEPSLVGIVMKGNRGSERVLEKTGFRYERDANFHNEVCGVFRHER